MIPSNKTRCFSHLFSVFEENSLALNSLNKIGNVTMPLVNDESKEKAEFILTFLSAYVSLLPFTVEKIKPEVEFGTFFYTKNVITLHLPSTAQHTALHISKANLCWLCHNLSVLANVR